MVGSAVIFGCDIGHSGYSDYYASAARSMSGGWKAFFFGAFDTSSTLTLDKLAGFLVPQALSVRIFGFSAWALALPQALEGLVTILATYSVIRLWAGYGAGVIGAAVMASTPLLVSMFSHPMEDGMLTMCTTLAILAWQKSLDTGRARYLFLSAAAVGLGFQAKMMQAWLVLPAMAITYAIMQTHTWVRKIRDLCAAGMVTAVVSLSWMSAIALVPAGKRPFIDGTMDNNIYSMVFGYNGINRYLPGLIPGALAPGIEGGVAGGTAEPGAEWLAYSPVKLFLPYYSTQVGWLYPLALAGLVLGFLYLHRNLLPGPAAPRLKTGLLLATGLLLTAGTLMSFTAVPHPVYLASLAFPIAALAALGATLLWKSFTTANARLRYALALYLLIQTIWSVGIIETSGTFALSLIPVIEVAAVGGTLLAFVGANRPQMLQRGKKLLGALAVCVVLAGPGVWSLSTLDPRYDGTANDAYAGPRPTAIDQASRDPLHPGPFGPGLNSNRTIPGAAAREAAIYQYARLHAANNGAFILATDSWRSAAPLIMEGETRLLPVGGYSSQVPDITPPEIAQLISAGSLRFILLDPTAQQTGPAPTNPDSIRNWVSTHCAVVPEYRYALPPDHPNPAAATETLFDCHPY